MINAYLCHHIRGPKGDASTPEERDQNRADAVRVADNITLSIDNFMPGINIYCPGNNDTWVEVAYARKILTMDKILEIDCAIIDTMDCMLVYDKYKGHSRSSGMKTEIDHCEKVGVPVFSFEIDGVQPSMWCIEQIAKFINSLKERTNV